MVILLDNNSIAKSSSMVAENLHDHHHGLACLYHHGSVVTSSILDRHAFSLDCAKVQDSDLPNSL